MLELALEQAEHGRCQKRRRQIDQQPVEAGARDGPDIVGQFFVAGDAAERLQVLVRLLLDDVDDIVDGDDADQPVGGIDDGGSDQIVLAEHPRDLFQVVEHRDPAAVFVGQFGERHRPARAQQRVERNGAVPVLVGIDRVDLVKAAGQIGGVAHVVDGLANGPVRRHRDELRLHAPACGVLRIKQAALQRIALGGRQLFEDLFLVLLVEAFEQFDGVVGFQFAHTLRDRLRLQLLENFLADGIVDLVECREVEIGAGQFDELDAVFGFKGADQITEIGFVKLRHHFAQQRPVSRGDGARNFLDKFVPELSLFIPHREMVEHGALRGSRFGGLGNVDILGHAVPRRFDRMRELV